MEKISVIIPVYNSEMYVGKCIESLNKQTYKNVEIILVNDGSHEACTTLLEQLASENEKIRLFHFQSRKGVGAARNFGLEQAIGKYVYFLDSDDYLPKETLELLVSNIKHYPIARGRMYSTYFSSSFAIIFSGANSVKMYRENKYNLIKNDSAQNFLIKKSFIDELQLRFSEEVETYSDLPFILPALREVGELPYVREAIYFRRKRNDPILNPSLSQNEEIDHIGNFLKMYRLLKEDNEDELTDDFLDTQFLNFYRKHIVSHFENARHIDTYFHMLSDAAKQIEPRNLATYDMVLKREIRTLKKGDRRKYRRINMQHHFLRDVKAGLKSKEAFYHFLYKRLFTKMEKKSTYVFFESFQGKSFSDSPKAIYNYMRENHPEYTLIWSMAGKQDIPGNPKQVSRLGLQYFYYLARSKYWVINARMPNFIDKPEDTVYLQTWHGTPLKRLAGDMEDVHMPGTNAERYKINFNNETKQWDYLISPNAYSSEIFKSAFWFEQELLEVGYPRNDVLYTKNNEQDQEAIKRKLNLPLDKKIILYAPTWRDDEFYKKGQYRFELQLNMQDMRAELGDDYIIMLRMHYVVASQLDISEFEGFAYDFSNYDDIAELYLISDMLITDYSSVFFDYANLKRPILFYTYDLEKYRDTLRGFYIDMETEVPGPLLKNTDEVIHAIENIGEVEDAYGERYTEFYNRFCHWDDGEAAKKTVEKVFE